MKTILKILIVSVVFAFSVISCRKDDPMPDPPPPPKPEMTLSVSDIALMEGMKATVTLSNASAVSIVPDLANIVDVTYQQGKILLEAKTSGSITLTITDKSDSKRSVSLKIHVVPLKSGIMNGKGEMVFDANYRYQTPKTLYLAASGKDRKNHFLEFPLQNFVENQAINIQYKKTSDISPQQLQAKISSIKGNTVYTQLNDGTHFIFQTH